MQSPIVKEIYFSDLDTQFTQNPVSDDVATLKNFESIPVYEQKFQEALAMLKNLGEGKDTRDQFRYDEIRRGPQA